MAAREKKKPRMIMFRPVGRIDEALAHAVANDPHGRDASKLLRDCFWGWYRRTHRKTKGYVEREEYGF